MGCTSSAPNMVNTSTAEKSIQFEEEMGDDLSKDTEEIIYREENDPKEITVLPSTNTLTEPIDIVRNKSTTSLKTEKGKIESNLSKSIADHAELSSLQEVEKAHKLEAVVGKIVELHSSDVEDTKDVLKQPESSDKTEETKDGGNILTASDDMQENKHSENEQEIEKDDIPLEGSSPSQSESSRATRWEALADIAAELPPSLTVDPITGQIYAVSK